MFIIGIDLRESESCQIHRVFGSLVSGKLLIIADGWAAQELDISPMILY